LGIVLKTSGKGEVINVLQVDEDASFLEVSKQILLSMGNFDIDHACCVDEAFKKLSTKQYDVVIADYEMPNKDGLNFLQELKQEKNKVPFILFTGKGREEIAIKALNLGADGYFNKQGSIETVYGELAHGIQLSAARKKSEDATQKSEELLAAAFNSGAAAFCITQIETDIFVDCNKQFLDLLGYNRKEIIGQKSTEIHLYADSNEREAIVKLLRQNQPVKNREVHVLRKSSEILPTLFSAKVIKVNNQVQILTTLIDISKLKKAEAALRESEQRWVTTLASIGDAVIATDKNGKITFMNKVAQQLTGWNLPKAATKPLKQVFCIINEETKAAIEDPIIKVLKQGVIVDLANPTILIGKDGKETPISYSGALIKDENNNLTGIVFTFQDITERKQAEATARRNEQNRIEQLTMMGEFSRKINLAETLDEICILVCRQLKEIIGQGYVTITMINETEQNLTIRATEGFEDKSMVKSAIRLLGADPRDMVYYVKDIRPEELEQFRSGKLELITGGLYAANTRKYSEVVSRMLERLMEIRFVYTIGFTYKCRHLGGAIIMLNSQTTIPNNKDLIETLMGQTSPAINCLFIKKTQEEIKNNL
jgi:PAS domain S-box-containing protein